jgi:PIN domain nuclease of toxin-antitoxin system
VSASSSLASTGRRFLLDTHVLIWWMRDETRLSTRASAIIKNPENQILISAAVAWELAIKVKLEKIRPATLIEGLNLVLEQESFSALDITLPHALEAGLLPLHHRDPFDRLLVAQALALKLPILSADRILESYGVKRLW